MTEQILMHIYIALVGLVIGSFLSVCIYRIPRSRELDAETEGDNQPSNDDRLPISFNTPRRSICPRCSTQLLWYHNIPVFSWLFLRGKCAFCSAPISFRYPLVEALTGVAAIACYRSFELTPTSIIIFLFICSLIVITFIDYDFFIIPNVITIPGTTLGLAFSIVNEYTGFFGAPLTSGTVETTLGILLGAGFLFLVSEVYLRLRKIEGLGMGDVKLLAMTGAFFGPSCSLYTIFLGSLLGSIIGIALLLLVGRKMNQPIPFGPYLAGATIIYIFSGDALLQLIAGSIARLLM